MENKTFQFYGGRSPPLAPGLRRVRTSIFKTLFAVGGGQVGGLRPPRIKIKIEIYIKTEIYIQIEIYKSRK